jgi:hypothetical protein
MRKLGTWEVCRCRYLELTAAVASCAFIRERLPATAAEYSNGGEGDLRMAPCLHTSTVVIAVADIKS